MNPKTNYLNQILGDNPDAMMALREIPLLKDCSKELQRFIFQYGRISSLREGEDLTREGDFDQWVFFIIDGRLAVYVGEEWVDTISSSLVGERCILGEARKATLKAAEGGVAALGVDMALLDLLRDSRDSAMEHAAVYVELLSLITGEIVKRIAELEYNRIDIGNKYETYLKSDRITAIIGDLKDNAYLENPKINLEIYKFLTRRERSLLASCAGGNITAINTRHLYARCIHQNRLDLIFELAEALHDHLDRVKPAATDENGAGADSQGFHDFARLSRQRLLEEHGELAGDKPGRRGITAGEWLKRFTVTDDLNVDLRGLCRWLKRDYQFSDLDIIDSLLTILKEASAHTAKINAANKRMMAELSRIHYVQNLSAAPAVAEIDAAHYFHDTPPEEMISFFSKHILDVHLVQPYLEHLAASAPGEGEETAPGAVDQAAVDSLFD